MCVRHLFVFVPESVVNDDIFYANKDDADERVQSNLNSFRELESCCVCFSFIVKPTYPKRNRLPNILLLVLRNGCNIISRHLRR